MCFFQAPQAPQIVYQGPSKEDVEASKKSLEEFRTSMQQKMSDFNAGIQKQIDEANTKTADIRSQIDQQTATAQAGIAAQQNAYAVTTETAMPDDALVTEAVKPKDKNKSSLKIGSGTTELSQGAGLNIGV